MKTAIVTSDSSERHLTGDGHPEQPKRVESITNILKQKQKKTIKKPLKLTLDKDLQYLIKEELLKSRDIFQNIGMMNQKNIILILLKCL